MSQICGRSPPEGILGNDEVTVDAGEDYGEASSGRLFPEANAFGSAGRSMLLSVSRRLQAEFWTSRAKLLMPLSNNDDDWALGQSGQRKNSPLFSIFSQNALAEGHGTPHPSAAPHYFLKTFFAARTCIIYH